MSLSWPGNVSGFPPWKSWMKRPERGKSGLPCSGCCPRRPTPDRRWKMDGWMDFIVENDFISHCHCLHFKPLKFVSKRTRQAERKRFLPEKLEIKPASLVKRWKCY